MPYLEGESSSGKTWLLNPLTIICRHFPTPATSSNFLSYGIEDFEVLLWNDFRIENTKVQWGDLLNVTECADIDVGEPQNLVAPGGQRRNIFKVRH